MLIPATLIGQLLLIFAVLLSPPQQRGRRHTVEIHNHTNSNLERIYVSSSTEGGWGEDRLGNEVLEPRHYWPIEVPTGDYDFKITSADDDMRPCELREKPITGRTQVEVTVDSRQNKLSCRIAENIH